MISNAFQLHLENALKNAQLTSSSIEAVSAVSGGSVNRAFKLQSGEKFFFLKVNHLDAFPKMFDKEVLGLDLLRNSSSIAVPRVLLKGEFEQQAYLLLEFIETSRSTKKYWELFGEGLAQLHQNSAQMFGLEYNNYNGSLVQVNDFKSEWATFFIENRLMEQQRQARDKGRLDLQLSTMLEKLYPKLNTIFPVEQPALLHGDLWSGNYLVKDGTPCFMDPSVYYGHREVDLAMTLLFGGFDKKMYESYHANFPLEKGWEQRVDLLNLYPLLVHVNLFGASYAQRVKSILKNHV
jgi:fructosamine-3-kinase